MCSMDIQKKIKILEKALPQKEWILLDYVSFTPKNTISASQLFLHWKKEMISPERRGVKFYVHLPFCATLCKYCMYNVIKYSDQQSVEEYIDSMISYLETYKDVFHDTYFEGIYVWWWTPSLLSEEQLKRLFSYIFENFNFDNRYYKEIELNPSSTTFEKLDTLKILWFDRVSFWVQSFEKNTLKIENRTYVTEKRVWELVDYAKSLWFHDINLDIIAWLNEETEVEIQTSLKKTLLLKPYGITVYTILKDMERSTFYRDDAESFYEKLGKMYSSILSKTKALFDYEKEDWSNVLGFTLKLKKSPKHKRMYDAHSEEPNSIFAVWYKSFWKIWGVGNYETGAFWKEISFLFRKHSQLHEFYSALLQSFQYELISSFFQEKFKVDIWKAYKTEIDYLVSEWILQQTSLWWKYIWDEKFIWYYGLLFLDTRNMLACIKQRFYEKG